MPASLALGVALCQFCVKTNPVTLPLSPQDVVGEAHPVLVEPVLDVLCSEHLEVQHEGKIPPATLGSVPGGLESG